MITTDDKKLYEEMLGDEGVFQEISGWESNYPFELYTKKEYKNYSVRYLDVVYDSIKYSMQYAYGNEMARDFNFVGKDGKWRTGFIAKSKEDKDYNLFNLRKEHLEEFLKYYQRELVLNYIEEGLNEEYESYREYLFNRLKSTQEFMCSDIIMRYLELEGGKSNLRRAILMQAVQENTEEYFKETNTLDDMHTNKRYRELQDKVLEHLEDKEMEETEGLYTGLNGFKSLWGD